MMEWSQLASNMEDFAWAIALLVIAGASTLTEKIRQRAKEKELREKKLRKGPEGPVGAKPPVARGERSRSGAPARQRPQPPRRPAPPVARREPEAPRRRPRPPQRPVAETARTAEKKREAKRIALEKRKFRSRIGPIAAEKPVEAVVEAVAVEAGRGQRGELEINLRQPLSRRRRQAAQKQAVRTPIGSFAQPSRREIRRAIVWSEILRPPLALRQQAEQDPLTNHSI